MASLYANKVIYFNYEDVPQRVIKGEVFDVTLKTLSTVKNFKDIKYKFTNHPGISILQSTPNREKKGKFYYDTFKFCATSTNAKLPDVEASLVASGEYNSSNINGTKIDVIALNPSKNFSNIIANELELLNYKTTSYDNMHNIIVFSATAKNTQIDTMHFKDVFKQGRESISRSLYNSKITYFVVIDKKYETFSFSYFNLLENRFVTIKIPIIVDDDSVVTQTDLKPQNQSHEKIKFYTASAVTLAILLFAIYRRKFIYIFIAVFPIAYIAYIMVPQKDVCIKQNASIHLLPVDNGTIFEVTKTSITLPKEGSVKKYVKVRLENDKIGWVKNEDTCSN